MAIEAEAKRRIGMVCTNPNSEQPERYDSKHHPEVWAERVVDVEDSPEVQQYGELRGADDPGVEELKCFEAFQVKDRAFCS